MNYRNYMFAHKGNKTFYFLWGTLRLHQQNLGKPSGLSWSKSWHVILEGNLIHLNRKQIILWVMNSFSANNFSKCYRSFSISNYNHFCDLWDDKIYSSFPEVIQDNWLITICDFLAIWPTIAASDTWRDVGLGPIQVQEADLSACYSSQGPSICTTQTEGLCVQEVKPEQQNIKPVEAGVKGTGCLQKSLKMSQSVKNWEMF